MDKLASNLSTETKYYYLKTDESIKPVKAVEANII